MGIQGIICGFADPKAADNHVLLIGRGAGYSLVVDGWQRGEQESTLEAGYRALEALCRGKPSNWREVREVSTSGVNGHTTVVQLGPDEITAFDLRLAAQ